VAVGENGHRPLVDVYHVAIAIVVAARTLFQHFSAHVVVDTHA
jgi:hypothetical protein